MKKVIKIILGISIGIESILALGFIMIPVIVITIIKSSHTYWLRELFYTAPLLMSLIPIFFFASFILKLSIILNLWKSEKFSASNIFKYLVSIVFMIIAMTLALAEIDKIGDQVANITSNYFSSLKETNFLSGITLRNSIVSIITLIGLFGVYLMEKKLAGVTRILKVDKVLIWITIIFTTILVSMTLVSFYQSRILNPGFEKIAEKVSFDVYGFDSNKESNYRWLGGPKYDEIQQMISGILILGKGPSMEIIKVSQVKKGSHTKDDMRDNIGRSLGFSKEDEGKIVFHKTIISGKTVNGFKYDKVYDENPDFVSKRGFYMINMNDSTDIIVEGAIYGDSIPWKDIVEDIINNFTKISK